MVFGVISLCNHNILITEYPATSKLTSFFSCGTMPLVVINLHNFFLFHSSCIISCILTKFTYRCGNYG